MLYINYALCLLCSLAGAQPSFFEKNHVSLETQLIGLEAKPPEAVKSSQFFDKKTAHLMHL